MTKKFVYLIMSAGLVLMTACGSADEMPVDPKSDEVPSLSTPNSVPPPVTDTPSIAAQKMSDLSRENLSQRLKISIDQIVVVNITPITWRDASLGCPKPGIDYIRVETRGYTIVLEALGKTYNYHTDESRRVVLCNK